MSSRISLKKLFPQKKNESIGINKIKIGYVLDMRYRGEYSTEPHPYVLVLNPNWRGKMHAIALTHIKTNSLNSLKDELEGGRKFKLFKGGIYNPRKFYYNTIKKWLNRSKESAYRTYIRKNMNNVKLIGKYLVKNKK